jgi:hypothetical protein
MKVQENLSELSPETLADLVNQNPNFSAKAWRKHGLVRLYITQKGKTFAELRYNSDDSFKEFMYRMTWEDIENILNNVETPNIDLSAYIETCLNWLKDNGKLKPGTNIQEKVNMYTKKIKAGYSCSVDEVRAKLVYRWLGGSTNLSCDYDILYKFAREADKAYSNWLKANDGRGTTEKALDQLYGAGKWDARDREDYEG